MAYWPSGSLPLWIANVDRKSLVLPSAPPRCWDGEQGSTGGGGDPLAGDDERPRRRPNSVDRVLAAPAEVADGLEVTTTSTGDEVNLAAVSLLSASA